MANLRKKYHEAWFEDGSSKKGMKIEDRSSKFVKPQTSIYSSNSSNPRSSF